MSQRRARYGQREHDEQCALFQWALSQVCVHPELTMLYAIPNGGHRHKAVAAKLKREGVKAGVPDICLPVARGGWHGLYIEMKVGQNKPTKHQERWLENLNEYGYLSVVCWGFEEARQTLIAYLGERVVNE